MPRTSNRPHTVKYDPERFRKDLGQRLRTLRLEQHLTQAQLADAAGIGNEFVSRLEHGHGSPSLDTLGKLAIALSVPVSELFEFDGDQGDDPVRRKIDRALEQVDEDHAELIAGLAGEIARHWRKR